MKISNPHKKTALSLAVCASVLIMGMTSPTHAAAAKKAAATAGTSTTDSTVPATSTSPTSKGNLPNGKPFRYIQSQIADLQAQIDVLVGRVSSLEERVTATEAAIEYLKLQDLRLQALIDAARTDITRLQQRLDTNESLIALLQSQLDQIKATLATKQDILAGSCPEGQFVQGYSPDIGLICKIGTGIGGLTQTRVNQTYTIASGSQLTATVDCPAGSFPTGGSYDTVTGLLLEEAGSTATGYSVMATNPTATDLSLNVFSNCLAVQR